MTLSREIARNLGLPEQYVLNVAANASHSYRHYRIAKRDGGQRDIFHPSTRLKALQRYLSRYVIGRWPVHEAAMAYRSGVNIRANAAKHAQSNYLLRLDLKAFFPSITEADLQLYLADVEPAWSDEDRMLFVRIVCLNGRLTIGAPTSPSVSNAICFELDRRLTELAGQLGVSAYTRYADDLFFSTLHPDVLIKMPSSVEAILNSLETPSGLVLNAEKTRHSSRAGRRRVTGLVLGSDHQVRVGRALKRKVRALVHKWESLTAVERQRLAGTLAFIRDVEPEFLNSLYMKYEPSLVERALRG